MKIDSNNRVKLIDFGLSEILESGSATATMFPISWSDIEGLESKKYSKESDIWFNSHLLS